AAVADPYFTQALGDKELDRIKLASILQQRTVKLTDIPDTIDFFCELPQYDKELFVNKKSKTNLENAPVMLKAVYDKISALEEFNHDTIHDALINLATELEVKNGTVMWPARIAVAGKQVTPGGAIEILEILGKEESLRRMQIGLEKLA
ncbi:MAG: glutamate--tRNA ligase, partial [Ruminococcus sp.]|nr:glutamate--tRNA ligase [Ruminococcus sp.]